MNSFDTIIAPSSFHSYMHNMDKHTHSYLNRIYTEYQNALSNGRHYNFIFHGPSGIGKYTQLLSFLSTLSPTNLQYEKKIIIPKQKNQDIIVKVSDIHIEIDLSTLGCNAKQLWNQIYNHIQDLTQFKTSTIRYVVCKYLHKIHPELLDVFYYYIQNDQMYPLKFILISECITFIPDHLFDLFEVISLRRPSLVSYKNIANTNVKTIDLPNINSLLKFPLDDNKIIIHQYYKKISDDLLHYILHPKSSEIYELRDHIYKLLIYDMNIHHCLFYILEKLIVMSKINTENILDTVNKLVDFYKTYYNNYRSIFHIESIIIQLILIVNRKPKTNVCIMNNDIL